MSNDVRKTFLPYLEANGFEVKRATGKHQIWTDGKVNFTLPTGTVKSSRMGDFLRSELRKACKQSGKEFIDLRYPKRTTKEKTVQALDTHKHHAEDRKIIAARASAVEQKRPKAYDKEALDFCKQAKAEGWTQQRMHEALSELGYSNWKGEPYKVADLSKFLVSKGIRFRPEYTKGKNKKQISSPSESSSSLLDDVREIINSRMADATKERMLRMYFKG